MLISKILTEKGMRKSVADVISGIVAILPNDPYALQKAIGSLGGAKAHSFITIVNGYVIRLR